MPHNAHPSLLPGFSGVERLAVTNDDQLLAAKVDAGTVIHPSATDFLRWCGRVRPHHEVIAQSHRPARATGSFHLRPIGHFSQ